MKKNIYSFFIFLFPFSQIFGQINGLRDDSNWAYFDLEKTISGQIINYEFFDHNCGHNPIVSIAIVKVNEDTIRVLDLCTSIDFKQGDLVHIIPREKCTSNFNYLIYVVGNPIKKTKNWKKIKQQQIDNLPSRFDKIVLKTTWGTLSDKNDCERSLLKKVTSNSCQCKWNFVEIEKSLQGEIIKFNAQENPCNPVALNAAIAIVKLKNDTIRIIDYCNENQLKEGDFIEIEPLEQPSYAINIPSQKKEDDSTLIFTNEYDLLVRKTAWGKLKKQ